MRAYYDLGRLAAGVRHPGLAWRKLRGLAFAEVEVGEIAQHLTHAEVIVEAGAADGSHTLLLAETWPTAAVHSFEPVPSAFAVLESRTAQLPNVRRYRLALSDRVGTATLHLSAGADGSDRSDSSSLLAPAEDMALVTDKVFRETVEVATTTLDAWAGETGVERVDLLWLDMQGMEFPMLKASPTILATVSAICLEVSRLELYEGNALYPEVRRFLERKGFRVVIERVPHYSGNVLFVRGESDA